jgi:hypothetical protein
LIGLPPDRPTRWAQVTRVDDRVVLAEGTEVPLTEMRAFVVAYPSGAAVDFEDAGLAPPDWLAWPEPPAEKVNDVLRPADLLKGKKYVQVRYGPSALRPGQRSYYSTTLTNISSKRVRILRFAGYTRTSKGFELNTITGNFFSAQDFREWYGMKNSEWIEPGESFTDPNNYGSPPVLWAYYCEAEGGEQFIAGAVLD